MSTLELRSNTNRVEPSLNKPSHDEPLGSFATPCQLITTLFPLVSIHFVQEDSKYMPLCTAERLARNKTKNTGKMSRAGTAMIT